jgi:5-methyltetrahydropteroyltriglutamate--homocysteine methyltransferase
MSTPATAAPKTGARTRPPFRADHVGSFLRPKSLLDARERFKAGAIEAAELRRVEDEAIRGIVRFQEDLGVPGKTEGDLRGTYFNN